MWITLYLTKTPVSHALPLGTDYGLFYGLFAGIWLSVKSCNLQHFSFQSAPDKYHFMAFVFVMTLE